MSDEVKAALDDLHYTLMDSLDEECLGADIHPGINRFIHHLAPILERAIRRVPKNAALLDELPAAIREEINQHRPRCAGRVVADWRLEGSSWPCPNDGTVEADGKWWCRWCYSGEPQ